MRITHIANITNVVPNTFDDDEEKDITYLQIEAEDIVGESIIDYFPEFYWFLEDTYNSNLRLDYELPDHNISLKKYQFNFKNKTVKSEFIKPIEEKYEHMCNNVV